MRAARAARLFFVPWPIKFPISDVCRWFTDLFLSACRTCSTLIFRHWPIKFSICDVVVAAQVTDAQASHLLTWCQIFAFHFPSDTVSKFLQEQNVSFLCQLTKSQCHDSFDPKIFSTSFLKELKLPRIDKELTIARESISICLRRMRISLTFA